MAHSCSRASAPGRERGAEAADVLASSTGGFHQRPREVSAVSGPRDVSDRTSVHPSCSLILFSPSPLKMRTAEDKIPKTVMNAVGTPTRKSRAGDRTAAGAVITQCTCRRTFLARPEQHSHQTISSVGQRHIRNLVGPHT